jgi:hypothetical protein
LITNESPTTLYQDKPNTGENEVYEEGRLYYSFDNKLFYLTVNNNNAWALQQNVNQTLQIEKWTTYHETKFNTYFSPETYDFRLAKNDEEAQNQAKQIRFVFDLVDESYLGCKNNSTTKKLLLQSNSETNLRVLEAEGIIPTFTWTSSRNETSTLDLDDYVQTAESEDREMMVLSGTGDNGQYKISQDNLAWEVRITPKGASPMGLMKKNYNNVQSYTNYVDYLEAKWSYNNQDYTATARIVRKSYRVEDLPIFEFTSNPSTFTFPGQDNNTTPESELQQTFKIHGYHQHGTAYYDVDGNLVEKNITYGPDGKPVKIPLKTEFP